MSYELKPGFNVSLEAFHFVSDIYNGILEGDPSYINNHICSERVPAIAKRMFFGENHADPPIYVKVPEQEQPLDFRNWKFPRCCCFALLYGPWEDVEDDFMGFQRGSMVVYCWFVDHVGQSPGAELRRGLEPFDWDAVAKVIERD